MVVSWAHPGVIHPWDLLLLHVSSTPILLSHFFPLAFLLQRQPAEIGPVAEDLAPALNTSLCLTGRVWLLLGLQARCSFHPVQRLHPLRPEQAEGGCWGSAWGLPGVLGGSSAHLGFGCRVCSRAGLRAGGGRVPEPGPVPGLPCERAGAGAREGAPRIAARAAKLLLPLVSPARKLRYLLGRPAGALGKRSV